MISHFFKSSSVCRVLCVILAALTLVFTLSPALVQPAEAVAVADDLTLALTLLFTSWAGITFASNAGAQTAVSNLLSSKPAVASSVAGLITKGLVTEGSKLLLTGDVRTAFRDALTDIQDFFQVKSDAVAAAGGGQISGSALLNVPYSLSSDTPTLVFPGNGTITVSDGTSSTSFYGVENPNVDNGRWDFYSSGSKKSLWPSVNGKDFTFTLSLYSSDPTKLRVDQYSISTYWQSNGEECHTWFTVSCGFVPTSVTLTAAPDTISFKQSKYINGTEAEELTWPETTITNPIDPSSPTEDGSENKIPVWPLGPQTSVITNAKTTDQADNDPGLDPEKMIEELRKLLQQQQPHPDPDPEPDPDPDPDPSDPDTPGGGDGTPPDFNGMMLPGLKDFFPFCIPFDLYNMMQALCAEPEAPKFQFATSFLGQVYTVDIDLSAWDNVAATIRYMVVAIYIVALAVATRKFIKW